MAAWMDNSILLSDNPICRRRFAFCFVQSYPWLQQASHSNILFEQDLKPPKSFPCQSLLSWIALSMSNFFPWRYFNFLLSGATIHRLWFTGLLNFKEQSEKKGRQKIGSQEIHFNIKTVLLDGFHGAGPVTSTMRNFCLGLKLLASVIPWVSILPPSNLLHI